MINELLQALATLVAIVVGFMTIRHYRLKDRRNKAEEQKQAELRRKHNHRQWLLTWGLLIGAALLLAGTPGYGQTNSEETANSRTSASQQHPTSNIQWTDPQPSTVNPQPGNAWALLVADDARRRVYDFLSGFTMAGMLHALFVAYLASKGLRNYTPLGNAKGIGTLLRWINLEAGTNGTTDYGPRTTDRGAPGGGTPCDGASQPRGTGPANAIPAPGTENKSQP